MSIQFKRSTVSGVQPSSTNMYQGELAINLPDKKLFTMDNNNEIINIGFSKDEADSTYLPFTGGTITGPLEISNSTPFIDFHYNYSTADYTHRIIASDSNTLKLIANTTEVSGALKVDGSVSTTNIVASGSITASGTLTINNMVRANTFRAAGGVPANDAATCGYSFDNNGDSGVFYENASTTAYGGYLNLRNDGSLCLSLNSTQAVIYPLLNAQGGIYTGTNALQNTMSTNNGIIELYAATPAIDFHYNNSTADYTQRIIATDANTLSVYTSAFNTSGSISAGVNISANGIYGGSLVQAPYIHSTGDLHGDGNTYTNNIYVNGTTQTNYLHSTGDLHGDGNTYTNNIYVNGTTQTNYLHTTGNIQNDGSITTAYIHNAGQSQFDQTIHVGSALMQTDGNIYMPWAGDWLSNVLARKDNPTSITITSGKLGGLTGWAGDQYPSSSGVLYIMSAHNTTVVGYLNGTQVLLTSKRDKYGTGNCSFSMPFSAGDLVQVRGAQSIYARYYQ